MTPFFLSKRSTNVSTLNNMTSSPAMSFSYMESWMSMSSTYSQIKTVGSPSDPIWSCPSSNWGCWTAYTSRVVVCCCVNDLRTPGMSRGSFRCRTPQIYQCPGEFLAPVGKQSYTCISFVPRCSMPKYWCSAWRIGNIWKNLDTSRLVDQLLM